MLRKSRSANCECPYHRPLRRQSSQAVCVVLLACLTLRMPGTKCGVFDGPKRSLLDNSTTNSFTLSSSSAQQSSASRSESIDKAAIHSSPSILASSVSSATLRPSSSRSVTSGLSSSLHSRSPPRMRRLDTKKEVLPGNSTQTQLAMEELKLTMVDSLKGVLRNTELHEKIAKPTDWKLLRLIGITRSPFAFGKLWLVCLGKLTRLWDQYRPRAPWVPGNAHQKPTAWHIFPTNRVDKQIRNIKYFQKTGYTNQRDVLIIHSILLLLLIRSVQNV
ncbi:unnamed protein product [Protopolystoma xenopodis]|uniref:Uncharacterized protein n=1 Tax=Protopolystoma xenopodis TaxID=117903 RepID=A0A448WZR9_9PLAT|nr:unnamed protein product [Protopolystoma xenopodis]